MPTAAPRVSARRDQEIREAVVVRVRFRAGLELGLGRTAVAKRGDGGYRIIPASKDLGEPKWPAESWEEIVELAFKGKVIDNINHAIFEKLRGNLK